ncbi:MAG: thioredoxin family protein [Bacteroides sp.]
MMRKADELKSALATNQLVLVAFYTAQTVRNVWLRPAIEGYRRQTSKTIQLVEIDKEDEPLLADFYHVGSAPVFLLLSADHELWRQQGKLTVDEWQEVLDEF